VTAISDGQEGVLQHTDCTLFGSDTGGSTENRVFLQRSGEEVEFSLCNIIGTFDLEPGDRIEYECRIVAPHPGSHCEIEVTLWMTLRNI
jgi:hypothetical protein